MRLFSTLCVAGLASNLAHALPTANNNNLEIITREQLENNVNQVISTQLEKRDSPQFIDSLISSLVSTNLLKEFASQIGISPEIQKDVSDLVDKANIDVSSITNALEESGLYSKFIGFVLSNKNTREVGLEHAKRLYQSGDLDLSVLPKRNTKAQEVPVSKKDQEYIAKIVRSLNSSDLLSLATKTLLENKEAASSLISSAFANVDAEELFKKISQSGIVSDLLKNFTSNNKLKARFAEEVSGLVHDGIVERDDVLVLSTPDVVPAVSVSEVLPLAIVATPVSASTEKGFFDGLFGGDDDITTTVQSVVVVPTGTASTTEKGFFDALFGGDDTTTTATTVATAATTAGSSSGGSLIGDILDALFSPSDSSASESTSSSSDSSSGGLLSGIFSLVGDVLSSLFGGSSSSSPSTSTSDISWGSIIGSIVESIVEGLFGDIGSSSSSSSGSSSSKAGTCSKTGPSGKKCCSKRSAKRAAEKRELKKMIRKQVAESLMKRQDLFDKRDSILSKRANLKAL